MFRHVLHSKIHFAKVTAAYPTYVGSITIDEHLLAACGMRVNDHVHVANARTGARIETYVFLGEPGSGKIELNGAAALHFEVGDEVIIMHYAAMTDEEYAKHFPRVVIVADGNRVGQMIRYEPNDPASRGQR